MTKKEMAIAAVERVKNGEAPFSSLWSFEAIPLNLCRRGDLALIEAYLSGSVRRSTYNEALIGRTLFGVEIECVAPFSRVITYVNQSGDDLHFEGYNHATRRTFKIVSDASVMRIPHYEGDPGEIVSPILTADEEGFERLKIVCDALRANGAKVNKSCGLHVHIDATSLPFETYRNVFVNYSYLEQLIDTCMPLSRRENNNRFSRSIRQYTERLKSCTTHQEVSRLIGTRYVKVNPESFSRHRTIEFRQHSGSTNYEKIKRWVTFCAAFVEWSREHVLTEVVSDLNDPRLAGLPTNLLTIRNN